MNVDDHLSSLIAGRSSGRPFTLINDGDLLGLSPISVSAVPFVPGIDIFGVLVGLLVVFFGFWIVCLVDYGGLFPVVLELIIAGCDMLVGRNAGTDLHRVLGRLLIQVSLMISFVCSVTLVVLVNCCWLISYL